MKPDQKGPEQQTNKEINRQNPEKQERAVHKTGPKDKTAKEAQIQAEQQ